VAEAGPGVAPPLRVERVTAATWRAYRDVRQAALIDSPRAFWTTWAESARRSDEEWQAFVETGPAVWLAWDGDRPVGTVGLWHADEQPPDEVYLIGMWVAGAARGSGAAAALVAAAVEHASAQGRARVVLDVARENVRAARFYLRQGFVPTGETGTMPWDPTCVEERMVRDLAP
jgi:RimJ/RimL family protein N-acetyltransferase